METNNEERVIKNVHQHDNPDSIEIGTPAKGGGIKVYGDFNNPDDFKRKIRNAKEVKQYAQQELN